MKPHFPASLLKRLVLGSGTLCLAASGSACFQKQATIDPSILQLQERIILLELKIKEAEHKISALQQESSNSDAADDTPNPQIAATNSATDPNRSPDPPSREAATNLVAKTGTEVTQTDSPRDTPQIGTMDPQDTMAENSLAETHEPEIPTSEHDHKPAPLVEMGVYDVASKYQEAYSHFNNRRFSEAKAIYQNIAENHSNHKLAPNAYYWWGEVEYDRGNYNQAVLAFQRLLDRFPKSHKVPDALLKLGKSREKLGQISEAREDYQRVIDRYPDSRAATIAKSWL